MLKEYTLKVTVTVGGDTEQECEERLRHRMDENEIFDCPTEITHEQVVQPDEVERE